MDLEEYTVEKNMIANVPLKYGKKLLVKERKDYLIFKFAERSAQIEDLQYEEDFIDVAKKINYKFSFNKKYQIPKKPVQPVANIFLFNKSWKFIGEDWIISSKSFKNFIVIYLSYKKLF